MKVGEVGSIEHARIHGESNLNTFRDGFRVLRTIFSEYGRTRGRRGAHRRVQHQRVTIESRPLDKAFPIGSLRAPALER
jgi:hypothetical protein